MDFINKQEYCYSLDYAIQNFYKFSKDSKKTSKFDLMNLKQCESMTGNVLSTLFNDIIKAWI